MDALFCLRVRVWVVKVKGRRVRERSSNRDLPAWPSVGEHDVTRVRPPTPPLFREQQKNTAVAHQSPHTRCVYVCVWAGVRAQADKSTDRGRRSNLVSSSGYTVPNPVLPGSRSSPRPLLHSKSEPDLKKQVAKKSPLCFPLNHTLSDVIAPSLCLTTGAACQRLVIPAAALLATPVGSKASWRWWAGSSGCSQDGEYYS